ncbi:MAG: glutamine--fructose-6-phosphate transaminase (isomerizing) [Bacteroidia bacterium]|nr:MAG: glutamine--fructose-6-phosphate transaminase (isomerizing) [Bacteroidia bacterium]
MCGIVGYTGKRQVLDILIEGLEKLEYRGYDSAGIAIHNGDLKIFKSQGNIENLKRQLPAEFHGTSGIAHTRWATHGEPNVINAHPHASYSGNLVMVHNGIIENSEELKEMLAREGYTFVSQTDTEVLLNLIDFEYIKAGKDILKAIIKAQEVTRGSYAIVLLDRERPGELILCRHGSPLVLGVDDSGYYTASDIYAISQYAKRFIFPENGDIIFVNGSGIREVYTETGEKKKLEEKKYTVDDRSAGKNGYEHYMQKEIFEQPSIAASLLKEGLVIESSRYSSGEIDNILRDITGVTILGCGTSWHSGLVGRYLLERLARLSANTEYASEFRYRDPVMPAGNLVISISQSGETADTLAANTLARSSGAITLSILNVRNSTLERETDMQVYLNAGAEIGVASTKAYTAQLIRLAQLAEKIAFIRGEVVNSSGLNGDLMRIDKAMSGILKNAGYLRDLADKYSNSNNFLFLGRGLNYPSALEGALKLKEISYIHAEGYPGAEMKHGPIALIDHDFPTMAIATDRENLTKMISNIKEIQARKGRVIAIIQKGEESVKSIVDDYFEIPNVPDLIAPIVTALPLQLFSYYISLNRGCNVDQPRNLAKSVTVE